METPPEFEAYNFNHDTMPDPESQTRATIDLRQCSAGSGQALRKVKNQPLLRERLLLLSFADEFFPALGAGNGDLALAPGHTHHLPALGAVVVTVLAIPQAVKELEELPVLLIPLVHIPGEGTGNGPDHQTVGKSGQDQVDQRISKKGGDQACGKAHAQNGHIQPVRTVAAGHEPLKLGSQLCNKLLKHSGSPVRKFLSYIILQNWRNSTLKMQS
jgi:hypothetical protein